VLRARHPGREAPAIVGEVERKVNPAGGWVGIRPYGRLLDPKRKLAVRSLCAKGGSAAKGRVCNSSRWLC